MHFLINYFQKTFELDSRSIIVSRILLGCICIYDLILKYCNLYFFIPGEYFQKNYFISFYKLSFLNLSLFNLFDTRPFFIFVIVIGIIASLAIILGKYTRISFLILWIIFLSFKNQIHMDRKGFEVLILMMFIWFSLIPKDQGPKKNFLQNAFVFSSLPSFGWILQVGLIYWFTFLYKLKDPSWSVHMTALTHIFHKSSSSTPFTELLYFHKYIPVILTYLTMIIEAGAPIAILLFFRNQKIRTGIVLTMIIFHFIIIFFLNVGLFSPLSICMWLSLLPEYFWIQFIKAPSTLIKSNCRPSFINVAALILSIVVVFSNISGYYSLRPNPQPILGSLGLRQFWTMFSNEIHTTTKDVWLITESDNGWDLLNEIKTPEDSYNKFYPPRMKNYLWRSVLGTTMNHYFKRGKVDLSYSLLKYLCRKNGVTSIIKLSAIIKNITTGTIKKISMVSYQCPAKIDDDRRD